MQILNPKLQVLARNQSAIIPVRAHPDDAGLDIYAMGTYIVKPFEVCLVYTGISVKIPPNCVGWITNKSRSNYLVGAGIIDEGYQGDIIVKVFNPTNKEITIHSGQAVAQLIIFPILRPEVEIVSFAEFFKEKTLRGERAGIKEQE